ncbi:DUF4381 domain-containing protein [uncultured Vibrio sp.]|uniref:DUF4381 domain-containing protein n=1 Tax=uncultured Vibrio sp. TaxID=114054 RepID=UPI0025EDE87C|nr:DUF4381 domain-containing protein [uncultured Vibrio sp.]
MNEQDLVGLSVIELQAKLLQPDEPVAISMWPETEGWLWLGLGVLILLVYLFLKWRKQYQANAYRREAEAELKRIGDDASAIAVIIRRTALTAYSRTDVIGLTGEEWLRFLDSTRGKPSFDSELGQKMLKAPYVINAEPALGLNNLAVDWVRHHKLETRK